MVKSRSGDSGVTLIEMLVVLSLIAVSAGVVTLALPGAGQGRTVTQEANLLAARLNLAAERSLIEGRHFRLDWTTQGYGFDEWTDDGWNDANGAPLSEDHLLDRDAVLTDADGARQGRLRVTPDLLPPEAGVLELTLSAGTARQAVVFDGIVAQLRTGAP